MKLINVDMWIRPSRYSYQENESKIAHNNHFIINNFRCIRFLEEVSKIFAILFRQLS